jgi:hypothetical protein
MILKTTHPHRRMGFLFIRFEVVIFKSYEIFDSWTG